MKTHLLSLCCAVVLFSLLTHVTWSVGKENTSQLRTAKEISQEVLAHLQAQRFTDAEKLFNALLASKTISVNGTRVLEEVYDQLAASPDRTMFSAWCEASKNSHFPLVVRGNAFLEEASTLRGTDYAKHVTENRWEGIRELLRQAQSDFEAAHALQPNDPESASRMIRVSLLRNHPAEVIEQWFKKAVKADSAWIGAYREKFYCTLPNWGGSEKEMMAFMRSCTQNSLKGSIVYTIPFEYLKMSMPRHQSIGTMYLVDTGNQETLNLIENGIKRYRKDFPRSPWPDYYQGVLNQANANMQEAVADFGKGLDKDPDNTVILKAKVMTQYALGRLDKAETDLERIVQIEPDAAFGYANLGAIQFHLHNNAEKGIELYAKAFTIEKDPSILKSYFFDLAELLGKKKRYHEAIQYYTKALETDPQFSKALLRRGETKEVLGDIHGAIDDMLELQQKDKKYEAIAREHAEQYMHGLKQDTNQTPVLPGSSPGQPPPDPGVRMVESKDPMPVKSPDPLPQKEIGQQVTECEGLYYRRMKDEAIACLTKIAQVAPNYAAAHYLLGKVAEDLEFNPRKALNYFGTAVSKDENNQQYIMRFGIALYLEHEYPQAISVFSKLLELNPSHGEAYYRRGLCFEAEGKQEEAIKDVQLAKIHGAASSEVEAFLHKHVQSIEPQPKIDKRQQLLMLAEENIRMRRWDEAEKQFQEMVQLNAQDDYALFKLGLLYWEGKRDQEKALDYLGKAIDLNKNHSDYFYQRAVIFQFLEKFPLAIADYSSVLSIKPKEGAVFGYRAECYMKLGEFKKAEADLHSAMKYSDSNKDSYNRMLAEISTKTGSLIKKSKENTQLLIDRGNKYKADKEYDLAKNDFMEAITLDPSNASAHFQLGRLYSEKLRNSDEALNCFNKAIELNQGERAYFFQRGLLYYGKKDFAKAKEDFSKGLELSPNDGQLYYYRGDCNKELGLKNEAIDDLFKAKQFDPGWTDAVTGLLKGLQ